MKEGECTFTVRPSPNRTQVVGRDRVSSHIPYVIHEFFIHTGLYATKTNKTYKDCREICTSEITTTLPVPRLEYHRVPTVYRHSRTGTHSGRPHSETGRGPPGSHHCGPCKQRPVSPRRLGRTRPSCLPFGTPSTLTGKIRRYSLGSSPSDWTFGNHWIFPLTGVTSPSCPYSTGPTSHVSGSAPGTLRYTPPLR